MRSPRSRCASTLAGLGALCLLACTDGVGRPFVLTDAWVDDGSSDDDHSSDEAGRDAAPAVMDAGMLPKPRDAGSGGSSAPKPTAICQQLEDNWSETAKRDAEKLVDQLNTVRANRGQRCGQRPSPTPPLLMKSELQCAARLRLHGEPLPRTPNAPTRLDVIDEQSPREVGAFFERLVKADFTAGQPVVELVIWNADNVESVVDEILEQGIACDYVTPPYVDLIGVAKVEHVWVIDLAISGRLPGGKGHP